MELPYDACLDVIEQWHIRLSEHLVNTAKMWDSVEFATGDPTGNYEDAVRYYQYGGAVALFRIRPACSQLFTPVVTITELVTRKHRIGVGQHHTYEPMGDGHPNYEKLVANLALRAREIEELGIKYTERTLVQESMESRMREELAGVHLPTCITVNRHPDGEYLVHVSTAKLSLDKLKKLAAIIRE